MKQAFAILALWLSGCGGRLAPPPPLIGPLKSLVGLRLGATAAQLQALRPSLKNEPYTGFSDSIENFRVWYVLSGMEVSEAPPLPSDKLKEVIATAQFKDSAAALTAYSDLARQLGPTQSCVAPGAGSGERLVRVVALGGQELRLAYWPRQQRDSARTDPQVPASVTVSWRTRSQGMKADRQVACGESR